MDNFNYVEGVLNGAGIVTRQMDVFEREGDMLDTSTIVNMIAQNWERYDEWQKRFIERAFMNKVEFSWDDLMAHEEK